VVDPRHGGRIEHVDGTTVLRLLISEDRNDRAGVFAASAFSFKRTTVAFNLRQLLGVSA
jgi:hypothetical protein